MDEVTSKWTSQSISVVRDESYSSFLGECKVTSRLSYAQAELPILHAQRLHPTDFWANVCDLIRPIENVALRSQRLWLLEATSTMGIRAAARGPIHRCSVLLGCCGESWGNNALLSGNNALLSSIVWFLRVESGGLWRSVSPRAWNLHLIWRL